MPSTQTVSTKNTKKTAAKKVTHPAQGTFTWFELRTPNADKSARFYAEVVGWKTDTMTVGDRATTLFSNSEETVAHIEDVKGNACFVSYVSVDNVDAAAKRVLAAGGKVHGEAFEVPTIGRMVEVEDGDGARFFLFRSQEGGAGQPKGPGGFLWNELWARDVKKAVAFFTSVLGYSVQEMPMPEFTYNLLARGEQTLAGIMPNMDKSEASSFVPYIHVSDVDVARAKALKLGATALGDAVTVENVGRMAVMIDPQGARFAVMTPPAG